MCIRDSYPALWYDIGPETASARNAMFSLRAEQYAAAYPKLVSEWSRSHGTLATGHQDNEMCIRDRSSLRRRGLHTGKPDMSGTRRPAQ